MAKKKKVSFVDDYIKANKKASREIELERNGGRWIAVDRPHKNKKAYDRKRDRKIIFDPSFPLIYDDVLGCYLNVIVGYMSAA